MLVRQNTPVIGVSGDWIQEAGDVHLTASYRTLKSDDHYSGIVYQDHRREQVTYVVNRQRILDLNATWAVTRRFSLSGSVPLVDASWSIPTPVAPPGDRAQQDATGIGDIILSGRWWVLDPDHHPSGNAAIGLGCKVPTGRHDARDRYPDLRTGANDTDKVVDQSIQPGDGGWGITFEAQGFRRWGPVTFYGSGLYLANPRDTNGAPSLIVGLGVAGPANADRQVNSVADSYVVRAGAAFPILGHWTGTLGFRVEGLPRYDLLGDSHGFRRPGYETFFEPGVVYARGDWAASLHVPIGLVRNRQADPYTGRAGDATFPDFIILASLSRRLGSGVARGAVIPPDDRP